MIWTYWTLNVGHCTLYIEYWTLDTLTKLSNKLFCYANFINRFCVYSFTQPNERPHAKFIFEIDHVRTPRYRSLHSIPRNSREKHFHFNVRVYCLQNFAYKIDIEIIVLMMVGLFKLKIRWNFQEIQQQ